MDVGNKNPQENAYGVKQSKKYLEFILDRLHRLEGISYRSMMEEHIIYYCAKVVGGIHDDRFLVKSTKSAKDLMPDEDMELPYEGAKEMLLAENIENREFLKELLEATYSELSASGKKK